MLYFALFKIVQDIIFNTFRYFRFPVVLVKYFRFPVYAFLKHQHTFEHDRPDLHFDKSVLFPGIA